MNLQHHVILGRNLDLKLAVMEKYKAVLALVSDLHALTQAFVDHGHSQDPPEASQIPEITFWRMSLLHFLCYCI